LTPAQISATNPVAEFAADVRAGLGRAGQKELPAKYFYDAVGSALFDAISHLPEYGLTRADERLLRRNAEHIVERLPLPVDVVELGPGSGRKTRWLLRVLVKRQPTTYFPIEISRAALAACRRRFARMRSLEVVGYQREFLDGVREVAATRRAGRRLLVLFLGSTIGNFDRESANEFLREMRECLAPGDTILLGTDLEKPVDRLIEAYDDSQGVTAAFNRNVLARANRELGADFDVAAFEHVALYNEAERRIEMHLRASRAMTVRIPAAGLNLRLREGETIWTESSYKYAVDEPCRMALDAGFRSVGRWVDEKWHFSENLWMAG
jgi:dimethylhistidine N-methyltransferase